MGKTTKEFIGKIQAEGTQTERRLEKEELMKEARKLADKMPTSGPDRQIYVRNLLTKALKGVIDKEVFKLFIKVTGSWMELEACSPRAQMLTRR